MGLVGVKLIIIIVKPFISLFIDHQFYSSLVFIYRSPLWEIVCILDLPLKFEAGDVTEVLSAPPPPPNPHLVSYIGEGCVLVFSKWLLWCFLVKLVFNFQVV